MISRKKLLIAAVSTTLAAGLVSCSATPKTVDTTAAKIDTAGKAKEGKCGGDKTHKEGKCGGNKANKEGKCGGNKANKEGKCGEDKAHKEGKCGNKK